MKNKIIKMLKTGKLPNKICLELTGSYHVGQESNSDYYVLKALCRKLKITDDDFQHIIDECFNDFGLK